MFEQATGIEALGRAGVLAAAAANRAVLVDAEARELQLAAHWAHLYDEDSGELSAVGVLPGTERPVQLGADGTPKVLEFAAADLAGVLSMSPAAGASLLGDALDLQYRHPLLWAAVGAGTVRVWQARRISHRTAVAGLSLEQAQRVDAVTIGYYQTLAWAGFLRLVDEKIIEADPAAAEARAKAAAAARFVSTGQTNECGLKTLIAQANAGDVIYLVAMCDRIAMILRANGDTDPIDARRATALGILANPARALRLLTDYAASEESSRPSMRAQRVGSEASRTPGTHGDADPADGTDGSETVGENDVHPSENDADDPDPEPRPCPTCAGQGTTTGDPTAFTQPVNLDPKRLLPAATLYVHLSVDSLRDPTTGVARFEDVGPITIGQVRDFLRHSHVTIRPVIDPAGQSPVDAHDPPATMAEALHLRNPVDIFPYATNAGRKKDRDHTVAYADPGNGGPPGQTHLGNLGPMVRFHHRLKTHGRWRLKQPHPGVFLWRSPHGWVYLVDPHGTHHLGNTATARAFWETAAHSSEPTRRRRLVVEAIPANDILEYDPAHAA